MAYYEAYEIRLVGLPDRGELADNVLAAAQYLRDNFDRADLIDPDVLTAYGSEDTAAGIDCRVQLNGGNWYWYTGDPQYDADCRGYWGHGWIPYELVDRDAALDIADDIIAELQEYAGAVGAFDTLLLGYEYEYPDDDAEDDSDDEKIEQVHHVLDFYESAEDTDEHNYFERQAVCGHVADRIVCAEVDGVAVSQVVTCPACLAVWEDNRRKWNANLVRRACAAVPDSAKSLFFGVLRDLDRIDAGIPVPDLSGFIQRLVDLRLCYQLRPRKSLDLTRVVNSLIEAGHVEPRYGAALGGALGIPPHTYEGAQ